MIQKQYYKNANLKEERKLKYNSIYKYIKLNSEFIYRQIENSIIEKGDEPIKLKSQ